MKALIICGGRGTRMGGAGNEVPKALMPIAGKPLVEWQLELLKRHGISDAVLCTGFLHEKVEEYFGDGSRFGMRISYSRESEALGTGGAIKNAERFVGGAFLVLFGDIMMDVDLSKLLAFHRGKKASVTITLHETDHPQDSDIVEIDEDSRVVAFLGRGGAGRLAKSSLYVMEKSVVRAMPQGKHSFENDVLPKLIAGGRVYGYVTGEFIKDVGTPQRMEEVNRRFGG